MLRGNYAFYAPALEVLNPPPGRMGVTELSTISRASSPPPVARVRAASEA